jgi:4-amino-4-deoxy-L-arabinose transferase-like glycosyltransferase
MIKTVTDAIRRHPTGTFGMFLALHGVVWTALPALFFLNLPLDLIEGLLYGREWQLGYDKLPPLPWWMAEATYRLFGPDLFFYALSQLSIIAAFALIWLMARPLVGPVGALISVLIIDGLHYFTFTAPKFNHDVIQLPFWALTGYAYWAALRQGRTLHWILLGFGVGMSLWAKYFVVIQAFPLLLFALIDRDARKTLVTPGPWIAVAVALTVMAPHLVWLWQNDFLPFAYADSRAVQFKGAIDYLFKPLISLLSQLGFLLPSLLIAAPYLQRGVPAESELELSADAYDRRLVTLLAFGPAAMMVLLSIGTGRGVVALWGYPLWLFLGLWVVLNARLLDHVTLWRIVCMWAAVFIGTATAFVTEYGLRQRFGQHYVAVMYPGDELGREMSRRYRALTGQPLAYVIASMWEGGNISHYAPTHPRVLIDGNPKRAPWIDLGDLRARGAVVVWDAAVTRTMPPAFRAIAEDAEVQPSLTLPMRLGTLSMNIGWAVLRPRPAVAGTLGIQAKVTP